MKTCSKCKIEKEKIDFYKDKRGSDGLRSWCKICQKEDNSKREHLYNHTRREYRSKNVKEARAKKKVYYILKKEEILSNNRNWRQTIKGRMLTYTKGAKARNIEWQLSEEEFTSFWQKPCYYCGEEIQTVGIDRKNNELSYSIENCVSCCHTCNKMKMDLSYDTFINKIKQIFNYGNSL